MSSQTNTFNNQTKSSSSKVPSKEPRLVFNLDEFREMKKLESAGDVIAIENLKKKVRQRMELEQTSGKYNIFNYLSENQTKDIKQLLIYH